MTILRSGMLCRLLAISFAMTVMVVMHQAQAAVGKAVIVKPVVIVSTASYNGSTSLLTVKGRYTAAGTHQPLEIVSNTGTLLASARTDSSRQFSFSLNVADKAQLCQVRVRIPGASFAKTIAAAPGTDCGLQPVCQITTPQSGVSVQAHQPVTFQASTLLKDNAARPLVLDWDFAGGSMGQDVSDAQELNRFVHPHTKSTSVSFDRDNSSYRVRFMARDKKGRYCEDSVDVLVGSPPVAPPAIASLAAESVKTAPQDASALNGKDGDLVVLPFPDYTMLANTDSRFTPRIHAPMSYGPFNTLNAQVIRKGRLPAIQSGNDVSLTYRSSSNPDDPVGAGSINTTSQNYPVSADPHVPAPLMGSTIRKTDVWETYTGRADSEKLPGYQSLNYYYLMAWWVWGMEGDFTIRPDEGLRIGNPVNPWWTFPGSTPPPVPYADDHGRYMPGRDQPYAANKAQDFTTYFSSLGWHTARNIPVTDIDDSGRVNPYPLFRVEAKSRSESDKKASVDATVTSSKDLHCRGCHAKGKIAANDRLDWSQYKAAYHSSSEYSHCPPFVRTCSKEFHPPRFADAVDRNGMPSQDIFDQEYAALLNITGIHEFYDAVYNHDNMTGVLFQAGHENAGKTDGDAPSACTNCHGSMMNYDIASQVYTNPGQKHGDDAFYPNFSKSLHAFHGQLQLDPSDHGKILRDVTGRPLRWDSARGVNPNSLFPVVDSKGKKLPDDMNCQMCHSGHREQTYRDRHATAGLVCADCHGDMMAVGAEANKPKTGPEGFQKRVDWYDQPDCGSCHTGNGNKGRLATAGYFSDGVTRQAFDAADASAMSRKPETSRFAVRSADKTPVFYSNWLDADWSTRNSILTLSKPLFRKGQDAHANLACGACHGGAHEIWPNKDPKANDNLAATQLQGYAGTILECNVCHTKDAFDKLENLDAGVHMQAVDGLPADSGLLGGPHGMHPVNDPNWWSQAAADTTPISDGSTYGGWHDNVYRHPGRAGEDQCAACHGADHKGTRLSKTPVDLEFTVKGGRTAKWKAGEFVGCDRCHSIAASFKGGPKGYKALGNRDPVITSMPSVTQAVLGQPYSYQVAATDDDGDPLTFSLSLQPGYEMSIDPRSGLVTSSWPEALFGGYVNEPLSFPYTVTVTDGKGGYATQTVNMVLECPAGKGWKFDWDAWSGSCQDLSSTITITSSPVLTGRAGETYTYQVSATDTAGGSLTFSLSGGPSGMVINAETGLVTWPVAGSVAAGGFPYQVRVSNDKGSIMTQNVNFGVCTVGKVWDTGMSMCM